MIVAPRLEVNAQQVRGALLVGGHAKIFLGPGFFDARADDFDGRALRAWYSTAGRYGLGMRMCCSLPPGARLPTSVIASAHEENGRDNRKVLPTFAVNIIMHYERPDPFRRAIETQGLHLYDTCTDWTTIGHAVGQPDRRRILLL